MTSEPGTDALYEQVIYAAQSRTSDDTVFVAVLLASVLLLVLGITERTRHARRLARVPWRVSVNGSRGKSTVVRLATGALTAGGHRTMGKTTGSKPALLRGWTGGEEPIHRRPEGPNVGEQIALARAAAADAVDVLVSECMAIVPEYQRAFHDRLLRANVLVVTNVLADHLDQMGPTTHDVAEVFADSVPPGGTLVLTPGPHLDTFRAAAEQAGAEVVVADPDGVDPVLLGRFEHFVLAEHVALVLALARVVGVPDEAAVDGMLAAPADPLATRLLAVGDARDPALFVNAFGANDPASAVGVWEHVRARGHPQDGLVVVMNCRRDRVPRTRQFAREVLPVMPASTLVVTGEVTRPVLRAAAEGRIGAERVIDCTGQDAAAVVEALEPLLSGRVLLGVGNLHGGGVEIVHELESRAVRPTGAGAGAGQETRPRAGAGDVRD